MHTGFALLRKEVEELKKRREMLKLVAKALRTRDNGGDLSEGKS